MNGSFTKDKYEKLKKVFESDDENDAIDIEADKRRRKAVKTVKVCAGLGLVSAIGYGIYKKVRG